MPFSTPSDWIGRRVKFSVGDLYLPEPTEVLRQLHGADVIDGRVVEVSDSGTKRGVFAAIKVAGVRTHCFVPVDQIKLTRRRRASNQKRRSQEK